MKKILFSFILISFGLSLFSQEMIPVYDRYYRLNPILAPFYHGVASGDALSDRVIIWTRVTPSLDTVVVDDIPVGWEMALDTGFASVVASGTFITDYFRDYTVKVDVSGLLPGKWYYYRFHALNKYSITGRTKTTPVGDVDSIRFAFVTGSNYNAGYFNAYKRIAARNDIDAVFHLGDYIYEYQNNGYGDNPDRWLEPRNECLNLHDYRIRYSHYRLDPDLIYAHQQYPWYAIWDDHEVCNNTWKDGGENHDPSTEGDFHFREKSAIEAYYEWIPIRDRAPDDLLKIYRQINYGNLLDVNFLETRLIARTKQTDEIDDTSNTLLGPVQYEWLTNKLDSSVATWKVIAQQVMMSPVEIPGYGPFSTDDWNGYRYERHKLIKHIKENDTNVVVLTGDIHTSWGSDLYLNKDDYQPSGDGSVMVEFITPSITSASFPFAEDYGITAPIIKATNNHVKYVDIVQKGYAVVDFNKNRTQTDWYYVDKIDKPSDNESYGAGYYVNKGDRFLSESAERTERQAPLPIPAPSPYITYVGIAEQPVTNDNFVLIGTYPNPVDKQLIIQFYVYKQQSIIADITDLSGKVVKSYNLGKNTDGIKYISLNTSDLAAGTYILCVRSDNHYVQKTKIVKVK